MAGWKDRTGKVTGVAFIALLFCVAVWPVSLAAQPMRLGPPSLQQPSVVEDATPTMLTPAPIPQEDTKPALDAARPLTPQPRPDRVEQEVSIPSVAHVEEEVVAEIVPAPTPASMPAAAAQSGKQNIVILGDSLGDGLWAGIYQVLRQDKRFNIIKKSRVATGFSRQDYYDWNAAVQEIAAETKIDIAIVVMGTNDRQAIVEEGARHALFDPRWREIYQSRVDAFTQTLKATGARIYWLELPVMRSPRFGGDMVRFNEIFEERARENDVVFVRTRDLATGADGGYTAYGEDRFGRTKMLRMEDGIHFTMAGYELLGDRVADVIREDMKRDAPAIAAGPGEQHDPVVLRGDEGQSIMPITPISDSEKVTGYDMANRRPGRSDDWLWTGPSD